MLTLQFAYESLSSTNVPRGAVFVLAKAFVIFVKFAVAEIDPAAVWKIESCHLKPVYISV